MNRSHFPPLQTNLIQIYRFHCESHYSNLIHHSKTIPWQSLVTPLSEAWNTNSPLVSLCIAHHCIIYSHLHQSVFEIRFGHRPCQNVVWLLGRHFLDVHLFNDSQTLLTSATRQNTIKQCSYCQNCSKAKYWFMFQYELLNFTKHCFIDFKMFLSQSLRLWRLFS